MSRQCYLVTWDDGEVEAISATSRNQVLIWVGKQNRRCAGVSQGMNMILELDQEEAYDIHFPGQ